MLVTCQTYSDSSDSSDSSDRVRQHYDSKNARDHVYTLS